MKRNLLMLSVVAAVLSGGCGQGINTPHLTLFVTSAMYPGSSIGSRANADSLCRIEWDNQSKGLSKVSKRSNTRAMITYAVDPISAFVASYGLPDDLPVYAGASIVSNSWKELIGQGTKAPLAGVIGFYPNLNYWTGSDQNGNFTAVAENCSDWTGGTGRLGDLSGSGSMFLYSVNFACGTAYPMMCVTY